MFVGSNTWGLIGISLPVSIQWLLFYTIKCKQESSTRNNSMATTLRRSTAVTSLRWFTLNNNVTIVHQ
jgi:hypothetical protein